MAKSYVKYETPKDVAAKSLEALTVANDTGRVRKGANETTKSVEAANARLVLIAADVEPEEVVMHLPELCREREIPFVFIAAKKEIGEAVGIPVPCAACSIEKPGNGTEMLNSLRDKVLPLCGIIPSAKKSPERGKEAPKKEGKPKKEKKAKSKKKPEAKKEAKPAQKKEEGKGQSKGGEGGKPKKEAGERKSPGEQKKE